MTTFIYFDGTYAEIATVYAADSRCPARVETRSTTAAHPGCSVSLYVPDPNGTGLTTRPLCEGGGSRGAVLHWASDEAEMGARLAHAMGARYYKTRRGYDAAVARAVAA